VRNPGGISEKKYSCSSRSGVGLREPFLLSIPNCEFQLDTRENPTAPHQRAAHVQTGGSPGRLPFFFFSFPLKKLVTCQLGGLVHSGTTPVGAPSLSNLAYVERGFFSGL
jgi:hypothetical protein